MASVNKVILVGHLGADPEMRVVPNGQALCKLRVATNHHYRDKAGSAQEEVTWHQIAVWGRQAEACSRFLSKGRAVYVEGRLHSNSYTDAAGTKRYSVEIVAEVLQFLGRGHEPRANVIDDVAEPDFSSAQQLAVG